MGGAVDFVEDALGAVADAVGDVVGAVGDVAGSAVEAVSDAGSSLDDFVREEIPGGWALPVAVGVGLATGYIDPTLAGSSTAGATTAGTGAAGMSSAELLAAAEGLGGYEVAGLGAEGLGALGASSAPSIFTDTVATEPIFTTPIPEPVPVIPEPVFIAPEPLPPTDYSLTSGVSTPNVGLQAPLQEGSVFLPDGTVDYGFAANGIEGLAPTAVPSVPGMGGQGLIAQVPGGVVSEAGFISDAATASLGNPSSFINGGTGPSPLEKILADKVQSELLSKGLGALLGGAAGGLMTQGMPQPTPIPAYQQANNMPAYTPEYFQAVQQNYNNIVPQGLMKDVATPLQQWYQPPTSVVDKLFGGLT